jgi:hypothetical protein
MEKEKKKCKAIVHVNIVDKTYSTLFKSFSLRAHADSNRDVKQIFIVECTLNTAHSLLKIQKT